MISRIQRSLGTERYLKEEKLDGEHLYFGSCRSRQSSNVNGSCMTINRQIRVVRRFQGRSDAGRVRRSALFA